jgi:tetratricopeptide (TPR) repeat protein
MNKRRKSANQIVPHSSRKAFFRSALHRHVLAGAAAIAAIVFVAYYPSINGGFVLDDDVLVTNNRLITGSNGLYRFWSTTEAIDYWPATNSTFWLGWRLWGMSPTGYHLTNLILHVLESLLIWIILRKLSIPGAFLAAMIFAVHPVNVESVAWIAQLKETMAMLFFLLSILWYIKADMPTTSVGMMPAGMPTTSVGMAPVLAPRPTFGWCPVAAKQFNTHCRLHTFSSFILNPSSFHFWYWLSLGSFVLAMLSKGSAAVLPALLLGIVWYLRPLTKRDLARIAPFFAVAVMLAAVDMWFQTHGSGEQLRNADYMERLLGAGGVIWFYIYKALLPLDLVFIYTQWQIHVDKLLWWLPLIMAVIVTALFWWYRNAWARPLVFAWGFFCVALVPVMGLINVGFMKHSLVADHYQHISLIGVIGLATAGWSIWHKRQRGHNRWGANCAAAIAVCTLAFLTWRQSALYGNAMTLYQATLKENPDCWMAHDNLGNALFGAGRTMQAIEQYEQALGLNPDDPATNSNMGNVLLQIGRTREAIEHCEKAILLKPNFPEAQNNLGNALVQAGRVEEGIKHYEQAIRLNPDYVKARCNLGIALIRAGRFAEAADHFQQALRLRPDLAEIHNNLGTILDKTGRRQEAIEYYQQAIKLQPDYADAHFNLGKTLEEEGEHQKAAEQYKQALALKPDDSEAHFNLGNSLVKLGRPEEAIEHYRQALRLKPEFIDACINLALTCASMHQSSEAVAAAQKALGLARSQGKTEQAGQIEDWLNSYRAGLSDEPKKPPAGENPGASSGSKP